jgi:DNA-binding transcriptional ArsR family regulator
MVGALGEEEGAVRVALRRLRDAGLIDVFGRGRHTKDLPTEAAVRLLLGLCAITPLEPDSPVKAVKRFESLSGGLINTELSKSLRPKDISLPLDRLKEEHTLGAALHKLLEAAGDGTLLAVDQKGQRKVFTEGYLRVAFFLPVPAARIEHALGGWVRKTWAYGPTHILGPQYLSVVRQKGLGGRSRTIEIDETALETLGWSLATNKYEPR